MEEQDTGTSIENCNVTASSFISPYNSPENSMPYEQDENEENITPRSSNGVSQLHSSKLKNTSNSSINDTSECEMEIKLQNSIQTNMFIDPVDEKSHLTEQTVLSELYTQQPVNQNDFNSDFQAKGDVSSFSKEYLLLNQGEVFWIIFIMKAISFRI